MLNKNLRRILAPLMLLSATLAHATLIEMGDLNIIDDPGNPSDGLRYLDMFYSNGFSLTAALANAQTNYPNARVAAPSEWDDLFDAAGILYDGSLTAADAFTVGPDAVISSGANYDGGALATVLGLTQPAETEFYSDPDGDPDPGTTRDGIVLTIGASGTARLD